MLKLLIFLGFRLVSNRLGRNVSLNSSVSNYFFSRVNFVGSNSLEIVQFINLIYVLKIPMNTSVNTVY